MKLHEQTNCELTIDSGDFLDLLRDQGFKIPEEGINIYLSKKSPHRSTSDIRLGSRYLLKIKWVKKTEIPPDHKVNV